VAESIANSMVEFLDEVAQVRDSSFITGSGFPWRSALLAIFQYLADLVSGISMCARPVLSLSARDPFSFLPASAARYGWELVIVSRSNVHREYGCVRA